MARHKNPFSVRPLRKKSTLQERLARLRKARHGLLVVALVLLGIGSAMTFRSAEAVDIRLPSATPSVAGAPIAPAAFPIDAPQNPAVEPDAASGVTPTLSGGNLRGYVFNQAPDDTTAEQNPLQLYDYTNVWGRLNVVNGIWNTGSAAGGGSGSGGPTLTVTPPPAGTMPTAATVTPPWTNGVVFRSTIAASGGNVTINNITVNKGGNLNTGSISVGIESGNIFIPWGNASISTSTGPITFSNLNRLVLAGTPATLAVRLSIPSGATPQSTVRIGSPSFTASPQAGQTGTVTVSVTPGITGNTFTVAAAAPTNPHVTISPASDQVAASNITVGSTGTPVLRFNVVEDAGVNTTLNSITLQKQNNVTGTALLYDRDAGGSAPALSTTILPNAAGNFTFTLSSAIPITANSTKRFEVRLDINANQTTTLPATIRLIVLSAGLGGNTGSTINTTQSAIFNVIAAPPATPPSVTVSNYCEATGTLTPLTNSQTIGCPRLAVTNGPLNLTSLKFTYSGTLPKERISNLRLQNGSGANLATAASIANDNTVLFTCGASCGLANGNNELKVIADIGNACIPIRQAASLSYGNVILRLAAGNLSSNASGTNPAAVMAFSTYTVTIPSTSPNVCTQRKVHIDGRPIPTATTVTPGTRMLACWRVWAYGANYPTTITQIILGRIGTMSVNNLVLRNAPLPAAGQPECSGAGAANVNTAVDPAGPYRSDASITFTTNWTLGPTVAGSDDIHYLVLFGDVLSGTSGQNIYFIIQDPAQSGSLVTREPATFLATPAWDEKSHTSKEGVRLAAGDASRMTAENDLTQSLQANVLGDFGRSVAGVLIPPVYAQSTASYGTPPVSLTSFAGELTAASFPNPVRIFDDMIIQGNSDSENGRLDLHGVLVNTQAASGGGTHPVTVADHLWVKGNIRVDGAGQFTGNLATEGDLTTTDNLIVGGAATIVGATTIIGNTIMGNTSVAGNINITGSVSTPLRLANTTLSDSSDGRLTIADSVLIQGGDNDALVISRASGETDITLQSGSSAWQLGTGDSDVGSGSGFYLSKDDNVRISVTDNDTFVDGNLWTDQIGFFYNVNASVNPPASGTGTFNANAFCNDGDIRIGCNGFQSGGVHRYQGAKPIGTQSCTAQSVRAAASGSTGSTHKLDVWALCFSPNRPTGISGASQSGSQATFNATGIVDGINYGSGSGSQLRFSDILFATQSPTLSDPLGPLINPIPPGGF